MCFCNNTTTKEVLNAFYKGTEIIPYHRRSWILPFFLSWFYRVLSFLKSTECSFSFKLNLEDKSVLPQCMFLLCDGLFLLSSNSKKSVSVWARLTSGFFFLFAHKVLKVLKIYPAFYSASGKLDISWITSLFPSNRCQTWAQFVHVQLFLLFAQQLWRVNCCMKTKKHLRIHVVPL